jgi:hypothetical protein
MIGVIRPQDFETRSLYGGPGTFRDYRLCHLPTGMQWYLPGRPGLTTFQKMQQLFVWANRDLIALGWEPSEDWKTRMEEFAE